MKVLLVRRSLAATLALTALATSGCAGGPSYVLSADYASSMNDSDWHVTQMPESASTTPPATTGGAPSEPEPAPKE